MDRQEFINGTREGRRLQLSAVFKSESYDQSSIPIPNDEEKNESLDRQQPRDKRRLIDSCYQTNREGATSLHPVSILVLMLLWFTLMGWLQTKQGAITSADPIVSHSDEAISSIIPLA